MPAPVPNSQLPVTGAGGYATQAWYLFFNSITAALASVGAAATALWSEPTGTAAIFHRGPVPTPPVVRNGLTLGDKFKLQTVYNFGEVWDTQASYDAYPQLQNFLLYCQLMALALKNTAFDNNTYRVHVTCWLPRGFYLVSRPLIVPEFVKIDGPGVVARTPYVGSQSSPYTFGPFYGTAYGGMQNFLPTVVIVPRAHVGMLNVETSPYGNDLYRGSGVVIGKCWAALVGAAATVGAGGSGYAVGDVVTLVQPSITPYISWKATVTSVSGGAITGANVTTAGAFGLPPDLQIQQWKPGSGFAVFDPSRPGYFVQASTTGAGSGATLLPTWRGDFQSNNYDYGAAVQSDIIVEHINVVGYIPAVFSVSYGYTAAVMVCGLNGVIGEIETLGGQAGVYFRYSNDWRVTKINCVLASIGIVVYSSGSVQVSQVVMDTCGCLCQIDQSGRVALNFMVFMEEGNLGGGNTFCNSQNYGMLIGLSSTPTFTNHHIDINATLVNMGLVSPTAHALYPGLQNNNVQPALIYLANTVSSMIRVNASNWNEAGSGASILPVQAFVEMHANVSDVILEGIIDRIAGPAVIGPNAATTDGPIRIWDSVANGYAIGAGRYEMRGFGVPSNGTSGNGAGKVAAGSTYKDLNTGMVYRNTNTMASPTWLNP